MLTDETLEGGGFLPIKKNNPQFHQNFISSEFHVNEHQVAGCTPYF
jgi:hypothetical protein